MKHRNSHLLVGYWSRLRKGRDVPDQTDIDPRSIKRMLSHVFILEASNAAHPVYRLAGTSLCERYGSELKGTNFLSHWDGQSRNALAALMRQSLATRQPICLSSIASTADCGMVELETVLAPVSFGDDGPTRFLGMVQVLSDISVLGGRAIAFERLVASQIVSENEPISVRDNPPPPPPPPARPLLSLRSHPRAPHLRLVVSRPEAVHCEMDDAMLNLIAALEIVAKPANLNLVSKSV
ncbi:MAG TPA: PAS domain-containing protein [Rhizomicrobium sp.]|nr:PAS domain-containing protein [Rhizomicrobium sp.]